MKRIIICDDNKQDTDKIKSLIEDYTAEKGKDIRINCYSSGEELLTKYDGDIDIAILDVEMKKLSGIETGYKILEKYPEAAIIIITSYPTYMDDAMDLRVFRFFEKPVDKDRLFRALDIKFRESKFYEIPLRNKDIIKISENEIVCIYASQRKTNIITRKGQDLKTELAIKDWLALLNENNSFASPHYSYIVNLNYISELTSERIILRCRNGEDITIYPSKRKYSDFKRKYFKKMEEYI